MADALGDFWENKLIDGLVRGQTVTFPTTVYIALFTVAPSDSGGGTEVTGGSYARVGVTASLANFAGTQSPGSTTASSGTGGTTSNNNAVTFPTATASWGTVVAVALMDASTGGNIIAQGTLSSSQAIATGNIPSFAAGQLQFTLT